MNVSNKKPMVLVIAGPNGSGKSTITSYLQTVGTYTNADDVVKSTGLSTLAAAQFVDKKRYQSIEHKEDFSFETVLSSHHKLELLKKAKENDYFIKCIFILTANPKINIKRVQMRVASGGHDVSPDTVEKRYLSSIANIKELMKLCDILHVYDNSRDEPVRIIRKHKNDISIFPNSIWTQNKILSLFTD